MTLDDGTTTIILPDDLEWVDEYDFNPVSQDVQYTFSGGLVISESSITSGRYITLDGGENVWVDKTVIDEVVTFANVVDKQMTLSLPDARTFTVMFNRSEGYPVKPKQLWRKRTPVATDKYTLTIKLLEV